MRLESYIGGRWVSGRGTGRSFINPVTGEAIGSLDDSDIDIAAGLDFARSVGTPALAALTFEERGAILRAIADVLTQNRERYFEIARLNSGNTPGDAAIDVDGGIATLKVYARFGKSLGATRFLVEPGQDQLAKEPVFYARHVWTSRPGVALQINAFNFPSWGLWEKVANALLAGVASIAKPASATAWLSYEMVRDVISAGVVPEGALNIVCGSGRGLVDGLRPMDSLAFTGSSDTGFTLRSNGNLLRHVPRVNVEADSINATIIGPDASAGSALFDLARREVVKALSVKAGQLCTNIRRILVHEDHLPAFRDAVAADLEKIVIGDPADPAVRMGPLVNAAQRAAVLDDMKRLQVEATIVVGGGVPAETIGADPERGTFVAPTLLTCAEPASATALHETEVFGPCATLMPYSSVDEGVALAARANGALVLSLFSGDERVQSEIISRLGPWHGRVLVVDEVVGRNHTGHAIVMPQCVHGGPGRAGSGEELGGLRGLRFHMQRTAIQASPSLLANVADSGAEAAL